MRTAAAAGRMAIADRLARRIMARRRLADEANLEGLKQWSTCNGQDFQAAGTTVPQLPPGYYEPVLDQMRGYFLKRIPVKTEEIIRFPETSINAVVTEIEKFWDVEDKFIRAGLPYKRGMILFGPPGTGKSCTVLMAIDDVQRRGGVAVKMDNPYIFLQCVRMLRAVQPDTPLVVVMEDIDSLLENYSQTDILNILDGVEGLTKTVFLATTNYPEKLGARIINRPSRFDRRFEVPALGANSREIYLRHLFDKYRPDQDIDIEQWVQDTDGMSVSHLKELFVGVLILEDEYENVISMLKAMQEERPDSGDYMVDGPGNEKDAQCSECAETAVPTPYMALKEVAKRFL